MSISFCDWFKERENDGEKSAPRASDTQAWMMCSIDIEGRVVITCITLSRLGYLKSSKLVIFDPTKTDSKKVSS